VAMTWTVQPRSWARPTKVPMAVAGRAPHTMTDRTRACASWVTWRFRSDWRTARRRAGCWAGLR
jgi:hypothetical protein